MGQIDYQGLTNFYTYMAWQLITDPTSQQYKLREVAGENFDAEGFGVINGRYVIACTERYGAVGDAIDWTLANGTILHTIIGEMKSSTDANNNGWGHVEGNELCVVEFCVDYDTWYYPFHDNPGTPGCHPEWAGQIQNYENVGNYYTGITGVNGLMANLKQVHGKRWYNGEMKEVWYLGTYMADGYVYFNDDMFWRCLVDGSQLQVWYPSKDIWVLSSSIIDLEISSFNASAAGNGSVVAPNANVEKAVQWMIDRANSGEVTYSQDVRNVRNPDGYSYDCSSFVITGFYVGGFVNNAITTVNMREEFEPLGFIWIPGNYFDSSQCQRGDILLNETEHTQVYIGNNQDVNCGDTPARVQEHAPDCYGIGWDGILRYAG